MSHGFPLHLSSSLSLSTSLSADQLHHRGALTAVFSVTLSKSLLNLIFLGL